MTRKDHVESARFGRIVTGLTRKGGAGFVVVPGQGATLGRSAHVAPARGLSTLHQLGKTFLEGVAGDFAVVDVEALEDDLVQGPAQAGACLCVEALGVTQEVEGGQEEAPPDVDLAGGVGELVQDLVPLGVDRGELLLELGLWPAGVADEVEVLVFFDAQLVQAGAQALAQAVHAVQLVDQGVVKLVTQPLLELVGEPDGGVVADDLGLYALDGQVRLVAAAFLPSDAEEVEVGAAVASGALDDETSLAAGAPDGALEVVVVLALACATAVPEGKYALYAVEQLGADDGRVTALVLLALVGHDALVVGILEYLVEKVHGDGLFRAALGSSGGEPGGGDDLVYLFAGVLPGAVQLEGFEHERGAGVVEGDGADFAAVDLFADVEIADLGLSDGAAVLGFLAHLVGDVRAAGLRLVLVDSVDDGFDHLAFGRLAHVQHGGDDANAEFAEFPLGDGGVDAVSEDAVEVVDDDVVDVSLVFDPGEHLLEHRPFVDGRSRASWLYELVDDLGLEFGGFPLARFALGGNGNAFGVVVGVDLARGGHAEVKHCPLGPVDVACRLPDVSISCSHRLLLSGGEPAGDGLAEGCAFLPPSSSVM